MQEDTSAVTYFQKDNGLFVLDETDIPEGEHQIHVGKGRNYLAFKLSSRPYLYMMATCQYDEFFVKEKFICEKCRPAHHSFGQQAESCYPCHSLWFSSTQSDVDRAIYDQKCTTGQNKSIGVIAGTIFLILTIGSFCCCFNRKIGKQLRALEL